jgi:EAL domain-containing protein (putative c-di-GMP-specific phosphodiesterase class I)
MRLRPDIVKLDMTFVRDVHLDPSRRAVARALIAFAGDIDATLVAEGIETAEELAELVRLGAPMGQGYHLGRPRPPAEILAGILAGEGRVVVPTADIAGGEAARR